MKAKVSEGKIPLDNYHRMTKSSHLLTLNFN